MVGDVNGQPDVFVHDRVTGATERISVGVLGMEGNAGSYWPSISADGRHVAFQSDATNLVPSDANGHMDVFVHDRATGTTERVSLASSGAEADLQSYYPMISADGQLVAFSSLAWNLIPSRSNGYQHVYVHDRSTATTELVSVDESATSMGNYNSYSPSISGDGRVVAFISFATNLVNGDANGCYDVFARDLGSGTTERVSVDSSGAEAGASSSYDGIPSISSDGSVVAFQSDAMNLVTGDMNGVPDVFVHDRNTGTTERVSVDSAGAESKGASGLSASISGDGHAIAFSSIASDLIPADFNAVEDVFVHQLCAVDASWSNYGAGFPGKNGIPSLTAQSDPILGTTLSVDMGSSAKGWSIAALLVGTQEASIPMRKGGDLRVLLDIAVIILALPSTGLTIDEDIDDDRTLCGLEFFAQSFVVDPDAAKGQSASAGLKLVLGY